MDVDVAIIGTGPAGGMAACRLAGSGLTVAVIEQAVLPRKKLCGGLMPGAVAGLFDWDFQPLVSHRVSRFEFTFKFERPCSKRVTPAELLLVDRAQFDAGLVQHAVDMGRGDIRLLEGFCVEDVAENEDGVRISSAGQADVVARHVIAADGVRSRTARCLGLNAGLKTAVAVEATLDVGDSIYSRYREFLTFHYFCVPHGYGWIFPIGDGRLNCGLASWGSPRKLLQAGNEFVKQCLPGAVDAEFSGFPLPVYSGPAPVATRRVCLAGDAAGLVDPVSGEGIRYALWSGKLAAEAVLEAASTCDPERLSNGLRSYEQTVSRVLAPALEKSLRFATLPFEKAPDLYYDRFIAGEDAIPYCLN